MRIAVRSTSTGAGRAKYLAATVLLLALVLPGCGGGGGGGTTTPTHVPTRSVIAQLGWQLNALDLTYADASVTGTGTATVDATVNWTFATNDVDLYVTNTSCTVEQVVVDACAYVARANSLTAKPERLSFSVSGAGNYRFWIVNFGLTAESGTFEVGLTQ